MSAAHTPGPWAFVAEPTECSGVNVRYSVFTAAAVGIASGQSQEHMSNVQGSILEAECMANARLIAAAPDLLLALVWIHSLNALPPSDAAEQMPLAILAAQAAIARATGAEA